MNHHTKRALSRFLWALGCLIACVFSAMIEWWFWSVASAYCAFILLWSGSRSLGKGRRVTLEQQWWARAREGAEQAPLSPCCMHYDETGFQHDEPHCTRYRYPPPKPISREERQEIDRVWKEIISHLPDPECGEET